MTAELHEVLHQVVVALSQATARQRERAQMTPHEYSAMHHLAFHKDGLTPGQLGTALAITTGSVTKLVDRLEARNLVRRARDRAHDRRSLTLTPTRTALALVRRDLDELLTELHRLETGLDPNRASALRRVIHALQTDTSPTG